MVGQVIETYGLLSDPQRAVFTLVPTMAFVELDLEVDLEKVEDLVTVWKRR
jgi:hypothetical protein